VAPRGTLDIVARASNPARVSALAALSSGPVALTPGAARIADILERFACRE